MASNNTSQRSGFSSFFCRLKTYFCNHFLCLFFLSFRFLSVAFAYFAIYVRKVICGCRKPNTFWVKGKLYSEKKAKIVAWCPILVDTLLLAEKRKRIELKSFTFFSYWVYTIVRYFVSCFLLLGKALFQVRVSIDPNYTTASLFWTLTNLFFRKLRSHTTW